jgi:D-alanyl-D-alanine carboxypeptidase
MPLTREDVPVARRLVRPQRARQLPIGPVVLTTSLALGGGLAALYLLQEPLMQHFWGAPPVAGIAARPDMEGRLLGHFPYGEAPASSLVEVSPGLELNQEAAQKYAEMRSAAQADGVQLRLISAFRSVSTQKELFFGVASERNQSAEDRARVSAPPGYSEHSTGYAMDLGDGSMPQANLAEAFESTPAFYWLQNNAHRYNFRLSFPRGNGQGVSYEPWHWRFEGSADALRAFQPATRFNQQHPAG